MLLEQPSVSDSKKSVKALLDDAGVTITRFVRFEANCAAGRLHTPCASEWWFCRPNLRRATRSRQGLRAAGRRARLLTHIPAYDHAALGADPR